MANVTIDHPSTVGYQVVTEEAFEHIWEDLGWVIVEDDPPVPPSSESPANVGDINAAIALLPDIDDVRPAPVTSTRQTGDVTTVNTTFAYVDFDPAGTAASRPSDLVVPDVADGMWLRLQPLVAVSNSAAVTVGLRFASIVSGAVVNPQISAAWTAYSGVPTNITAPVTVQLVAGDISGGSVRFRPQYSATGARVLPANALAPARFEAQVIG